MATSQDIRKRFIERVKLGNEELAREAMKEEKDINEKVTTYEELIKTSAADLTATGVKMRDKYLSRTDVGWEPLGSAFNAVLQEKATPTDQKAAQDTFRGLSQNKKIGVLQSGVLSAQQQQTLLATFTKDERDSLIQYAMEKNNAAEMMPDLFNNADPETQIRILQNYGTKSTIFRNKYLFELDAGQKLFKELPASLDKTQAQRQYAMLSHKNIRPEVKFALFNSLSRSQQAKVIAEAIKTEREVVAFTIKIAVELVNKQGPNKIRQRSEKIAILICMMTMSDANFSKDSKNEFIWRLMEDKSNFRHSLEGIQQNSTRLSLFLAPLLPFTLTEMIFNVATKTAGNYNPDPELAAKIFAAIQDPQRQAEVLSQFLNGPQQLPINLAIKLFSQNNNLNYSQQVNILAKLSNDHAAQLFAGMDYAQDARMDWLSGMFAASQHGGFIAGVLWFFGTHFTNAEKKLKFLTDPALSDVKKQAMFAAIKTPAEQAYYLGHQDMPDDLAVKFFIARFNDLSRAPAMEFSVAILNTIAITNPQRACVLFNSINNDELFESVENKLEFQAELLSKLAPNARRTVFVGIDDAAHQIALLKAIPNISGYENDIAKITELQMKLFLDLNDNPQQQANILVTLMGNDADLAFAIMFFSEALILNPNQQARILHNMQNFTHRNTLFQEQELARRAELLNNDNLDPADKTLLFNGLKTPEERFAILLANDDEGNYQVNAATAGMLLADVENKDEQVDFLVNALEEFKAQDLDIIKNNLVVMRIQAIFREGFRDTPERQAEILQNKKLDLNTQIILFKGLNDVTQQIKVLNAMTDQDLKVKLLASLDDQQLADIFDKSANFLQALMGFLNLPKERMLKNSDDLFAELTVQFPKKANAIILGASHNIVYLAKLEKRAYKEVERADGRRVVIPEEPFFSQLINMIKLEGGEKIFAKLQDINVINLALDRLRIDDPEKAFKCLEALSNDQLDGFISGSAKNTANNLANIAQILQVETTPKQKIALLFRAKELLNNLAMDYPQTIMTVLKSAPTAKEQFNLMNKISWEARNNVVLEDPGLVNQAQAKVNVIQRSMFMASLSDEAQAALKSDPNYSGGVNINQRSNVTLKPDISSEDAAEDEQELQQYPSAHVNKGLQS